MLMPLIEQHHATESESANKTNEQVVPVAENYI